MMSEVEIRPPRESKVHKPVKTKNWHEEFTLKGTKIMKILSHEWSIA